MMGSTRADPMMPDFPPHYGAFTVNATDIAQNSHATTAMYTQKQHNHTQARNAREEETEEEAEEGRDQVACNATA